MDLPHIRNVNVFPPLEVILSISPMSTQQISNNAISVSRIFLGVTWSSLICWEFSAFQDLGYSFCNEEVIVYEHGLIEHLSPIQLRTSASTIR